MLVPWLTKPFHIDDPLFLWVAERIRQAPLDPYGFEVNWYGTPMRVAEITKNPPLFAYVLSGWQAVFGPSEASAHALSMLLAAATIAATGRLAQRLGASCDGAMVVLALSPYFLISASSVMCDGAMLLLFVVSVAAWAEGRARGGVGWFIVCGAFAGAAIVTKYFAVSLLPLLAVWWLLDPKRPRARDAALAMGVPLVVAGLYQGWTAHLYGRGLIGDAVAYADGVRVSRFTMRHGLAAVAFVGGAGLPALLVSARAVRSWRWMLAGSLALAGVALGGAAGINITPEVAAHLVVLGAAATAAFVTLTPDKAHPSTRTAADQRMLLLWFAGTLVFAVVFNWTINVRSLLPATIPLAIALSFQWEGLGRRRALWGSVALGAVSQLLLWGDFEQASSQRQAAQRSVAMLRTALPNAEVYFQGHWGFQWYMEALGGKAVDFREIELGNPQLPMVIPLDNTNVQALEARLPLPSQAFTVPASTVVSTMSQKLGAGLYASVWGVLPFHFGGGHRERYEVWLLPRGPVSQPSALTP